VFTDTPSLFFSLESGGGAPKIAGGSFPPTSEGLEFKLDGDRPVFGIVVLHCFLLNFEIGDFKRAAVLC